MDFIDKIKAKLPDGYVILKKDIVTQNGDILWNFSKQDWSDIVDESWRQKPDYHYPLSQFFIAVARRSVKAEV
ncbi:MAG: hypothetical protein WC389_16400 [Lutibacter sp.]|jgi:hypothetical protein